MQVKPLKQLPEKLPLDPVIGGLPKHLKVQVQGLYVVSLFVNDMLKSKGLVDGAKV